jgi:hypothetical protein
MLFQIAAAPEDVDRQSQTATAAAIFQIAISDIKKAPTRGALKAPELTRGA